MTATIHAWRHPRPVGAEGRCIGRTDLAVDRRKARRLARRIHAAAQREGLPRVVFTSPLQRCAEVGRCLRRLGWRHCIDPTLAEADFGCWDGRQWADIARADIDRWCADFAAHAPGGGEPLQAFMRRAASWQPGSDAAVVVAHAGWMLSRRWLQTHAAPPALAADWPAPPGHGRRWLLY